MWLAWVRHGETEWNRLRKIQGQTDIPLNETGKKQAILAADKLIAHRWDALYASDLMRAKQTAEIIGSRIGLPLTGVDERLRERRFGPFEGAPYGTIVKEQAGKDADSSDGADTVESERSMVQRGIEFIDELGGAMAGKKVIVVSHGGFIRRLLTELTGETIGALPNTSINIIKRAESGWTFVARDDVKSN